MAIITSFPNTIYFHIPKTAGTAISDWLKLNCDGERIKHKHSGMHEHKAFLSSQNVFTFTCVRHPYDWVCSAYGWMKKTQFNCKQLTLKSWVLGDDGNINMYNNLCNVPQHKYFNVDKIDLILKHERLIEDFIQIQDLFNCYEPLQRSNASNITDESRDMLTNEMKEAIYEQNKIDFEMFDYQR